MRVKTLKPGRLPAKDLERLNHGLSLDGKPLKPAKVRWMNDDQLCFVLREGKKRQIRRMCEAVGLQVLALKRVRIGRVMLGDLPVGKWRFLATGERFIDWKTEKALTEGATVTDVSAGESPSGASASTADKPNAPTAPTVPSAPASQAKPAARPTLSAPRTFRTRTPKN